MVICSLFLPIKSLILMLKAPTLSLRWISWIESQKILNIKIFENLGQNWPNFDKKWHYLQKCDLFKITFCIISWARMKLEKWNLVNVYRNNLKKLIRSGILNFDVFSFYCDFRDFFVKKNKQNSIKFWKNQNFKMPLLISFL